MGNMIEVVGPDGSIVEFPADTPRDVMTRALRQHFGFQEPQSPAPSGAPAQASTPASDAPLQRAPEEFPPGIAGAGPMAMPRDFSMPVETPAQGIAPVAEESILPPEASISGFVKGPPARGFQPSLMAEQFKSGVTGMQEGYYANAAKNNAQLLNLMDRIDRGESVPPIEDVLGYADMDASAKAQTRDAIQSALAQTTAKTVAYGQERQGYKRNENADRMIKLADDGDLKGALKLFASDPLGILQQLSVESAPNALPSLIGGAAGVLLRGGVAGLMTGLATGSFPVEYMASISESLRESGVDLSDVKAVEAKLKDPDFLKAAGERAVTRARVISAADAATGALLLPFKAGQLGRNIARGAANVASEVGTEMVGEAGAQTATGEELKLGQVLAEGLGAGPQAVVSTALRTIAESAPKETPAPERVEPTIGEVAPPERVEPTLETEPAAERVEPALEEEPSALRPTVREAPPAEAPTIPGLPSIEEFEAQEAADVAEGKAPEISTTPTPEAVAVQKQVAQEPPEETEKKAETEPNIAVGPPIVYPLVKSLKLSDDVPQFKEEADEQGVVERLEGKFDYRDAGAIQVWQRLNGDLEVISGRHRLDLARRNNIDRIPAQIYREADGFTAQDASILDAELNIRDEQGKVKDYVQYFQGSGITQEEADARGLLGRTKGKRGYAIANLGSQELVAAHRADLISDEAAAEIAKLAPNDARLQAVALSVRQRGGSNQDALNAVRAIQAMALEQATTTDMFGFDDSGIKQAVEMGRVAERKQRELGQRISILNNVSKNPKLAAQEGVDLKNPEAVQQRISELKAQRAAWDNWQTNPDLIAEVRAELAPTAPELQLTGETEAEITAREEAEQAGATEAEKKRQVDLARDMFALEGEAAPTEVKPPEQVGMFEEAPTGEPVVEPVEEAPATPEAPAVAPIVDRFASKVQTEGQTSEAFEDADGVQVRTTTSKWQGTTSRANFDELLKYAVASPQKQGRRYSIVLADTPDKSSILTFTTRGYTPTQKRVEVVMQLQSSEKVDGPTLANIEPSLAEQEGDLIFGSQRIREENIKEYARLRRKLAGVPKKVARGEAGIDVQRETARLLKTTQELKQEIEATKPRRETPERFLAKALEEYDKGNISADVLAVVQAAYSKAPGLLNGLRLRVQKQPEGGASAADFNPLARIVRLFKGTSGVDSPVSMRHELAHSLEQMMTPEQRQILVDQWYQSLEKAMQKHQDEKHQRYFKSVLDFMDNPNLRNFQTANLNLPSYDMYQYLSPSEYWAVNAEPLMDAQLGTPWNRFKMAVRRLFEGLKDVFGFDNKSPIYKTFKQIMDSDGQRISQDMLVDHIQKVSDSLTLFNVEAPKEERERIDALLEEFNRPDVTGRATQTVRSDMMPSTTAIRSTFREMIENPRQAINSMFGPLNRGIATVRNKAFFFGAGLEERDANRYGGQVVTSNDEATATLALDNMLHGRGIAAQFIMKGGLRYNSTTKRIEAHDADGSMVDVYQLEQQLKIKLGDERGAKLIQGYLEAKRSKSIRDEMARLAEVIEVQKESLDDARARLRELTEQGAADRTIGQQQSVVDGLAQQYKETKTQLDNIVQINEDKVLMSEEEIEAFINQDAAYPELQGIMDAWTATNHRLLGMMRQVRMISEKRYEQLMAIKDYVPWQRVQDDDVDIHFIGNPRAATNISKERSFKKGKVERPVDYIPDNMTDNIIRLTQSVLRQNAALRIVNDYATRDPETGKIKTFGKADPNKGRFDYISDGKRVIVEIQDPVIAESVYGLARDNLRMNEAIAGLTEFMRRSITIDPSFQVAQVIKDAPSAAMITGIRNAPVFMASVFGSFTKTVLNQDPVADILRANGIGGFQSAARTPEAAIKVQKGLIKRSPLAAVMAIMDHIGDSSDFASRIAVYKRTLAETKSDDMPNGDEALALYRAANVINFNRMGSSNAALFFAKYVIFANAYMQSIDTLFRAMTARGMTGRDKSRAMAVFAGTTAQLAAFTLLYSFLVGGDDEYEKLDDGTKTRNILIPKSVLGTENGILVPMNTSASFMFKALPELTYNMLATQATKTPMDATRYKKTVAEAAADSFLGPEPIPTVIRPAVEIATGRSFFTERPLVPRGMESMEKFRQYTDQTSEIAKLMGKAGGLSPIEYDHLIRGTLGTAGLLAQYGSNLVGQYLDVRPEPTAKQAPFVGRFIAPTEGRGREDLFYDLHERVRKATSTLRDLEQTGEYKTAEKYEREKELLLDLSREMNRTEAKLKKINTEIRMLSRGREEGTAKERRKEIDLLQRDKSELLEGIELLRKEAGL